MKKMKSKNKIHGLYPAVMTYIKDIESMVMI